ncbi:hypothetical protein N7539_006142 [Penicillium diatomitis]|uniref:Uncharacterized protein n=1 Tax=Penicillium diatomitis TaxID=2819901 RepID=A0A9X0BSR4_9EURO|nr:uncharacterized protein N7539_006142 [Penicillium diatomitis]KAJ5482696.1 hypothetical protein N7539_006142 [Penicillium diatomitis]
MIYRGVRGKPQAENIAAVGGATMAASLLHNPRHEDETALGSDGHLTMAGHEGDALLRQA